MEAVRRYTLTTVAVFLAAGSHAVVTWPLDRTAVLFGGGAAIAFALEVLGVRLDLFVHEMTPQVLSVPVVVVLAWPSTVYIAYRLALSVAAAGPRAAALAAGVATVADAVTEVDALEAGVWRYPEHPLSTHRVAGVPVWNFVAWFAVVFATATLTWLV